MLARRVDDLGLEVAVDVADRGRPQDLARRVDRAVARRARVHVRVELRLHRLAVVEALERRAVGVAGRCSSPLESASTVSSLLSPSRSNRRCDASPPVPSVLACSLVQGRVAVGEQHLAVLAAVAGASVTTTRTVKAGSFGSLSPGPFEGAVGSVGRAAADAVASSAARTCVEVDRAERAVGRAWSAAAGRDVLEVGLRRLDARAPTGAVQL